MKMKRSLNPLPRLPQGFTGKIITVNIVYMLYYFISPILLAMMCKNVVGGAWRGDWLIIVLFSSLPLFCPLLLFKIQLPNGPSSFAGRDLHLGQLNKKGKEFEDMQVQNLLSGAIVVGDLSLAKSLLRDMSPSLVDVNREGPYFGRPLNIAAGWDRIDIVQYPLDHHGADPNLLTNLLIDDCWNPSVDYVRLCSKHIYRSPHGSALRAAALGGHENIVRLLLGPKYGLPLPRKEYRRAILVAFRGGYLNIIEIILQAMGESARGFRLFSRGDAFGRLFDIMKKRRCKCYWTMVLM